MMYTLIGVAGILLAVGTWFWTKSREAPPDANPLEKEGGSPFFRLLDILSTDIAPRVRAKVANILRDHPGQETTAILARLARDPAGEVRKAADQAKDHLAEQGAICAKTPGSSDASCEPAGTREPTAVVARKNSCG